MTPVPRIAILEVPTIGRSHCTGLGAGITVLGECAAWVSGNRMCKLDSATRFVVCCLLRCLNLKKNQNKSSSDRLFAEAGRSIVDRDSMVA
jgi:hypothetical protein